MYNVDTLQLPLLSGVIGPGSSSLTEDVQNMLAQFQIPEIGYSATSTTLSDTKLYPYFLRVVAPDSEQAKALVEFIYASGWRYVSALYSEGKKVGNPLILSSGGFTIDSVESRTPSLQLFSSHSKVFENCCRFLKLPQLVG